MCFPATDFVKKEKILPMSKKVWHLITNHRPLMYDGVEVSKENDCFTIYRYIDDRDEDGDTIYEINEYLKGIPELSLKRAIKAGSDDEVLHWIKTHLIKEQSNAIDGIEAFLKEHNVPYTYDDGWIPKQLFESLIVTHQSCTALIGHPFSREG